jgi:hypothetical protein
MVLLLARVIGVGVETADMLVRESTVPCKGLILLRNTHHPKRSHVSINVHEPADRQQLVIAFGLRCDGDTSDPRPRKAFNSNRYNATMPAAQALPGSLATATQGPCSALKRWG